MSACEAELCPFWTGQGCACDVMGFDLDERPRPVRDFDPEEDW